MKIGIIDSGFIGGTLAKRLSVGGHTIKDANRAGQVLSMQAAQAVTKEEALVDADAVMLSIPFIRILDIKPLLAGLPEETTIIDTSNYIPARDERLEAIENGQPDSVWVAEQLGRPIAKAWNTIYSATLKEAGRQLAIQIACRPCRGGP